MKTTYGTSERARGATTKTLTLRLSHAFELLVGFSHHPEFFGLRRGRKHQYRATSVMKLTNDFGLIIHLLIDNRLLLPRQYGLRIPGWHFCIVLYACHSGDA
jgi:hypothetical protein